MTPQNEYLKQQKKKKTNNINETFIYKHLLQLAKEHGYNEEFINELLHHPIFNHDIIKHLWGKKR